MTDIDAAITARQFKEAVPQHEVDTKRKKDTPRSAVNAYKRKQAAIDEDVEVDQKKAYLKRLLRDYSLGVSANDIGADKVRSETYVYHPYDEDYEPIPYWSDETEWGPELLKKVAQNTANRMTGKETDGVIYGHNKVQRPPAMTADDFVNGPQGTFAESQTDINARMSAWHDATQHPERAGEFLRGYRVVNDKAVDAVKDSISPNGEIKESANETDPKEFMPAMADAVAEDAMDDFEAQGVKHMMDTKKERAKAVEPIVLDEDKVRGAEVVGHDSTVSPEKGVTGMDVDTSMYLESLMDKGLITPEQYIEARRAFKDGRDRGLPERMDNELMRRLGTPAPDGLGF